MHIQFRYFEYTKAKQKYVYRHPIIPLVRKCMKAILQSVCISNVCFVLDKFTCSVYSFTKCGLCQLLCKHGLSHLRLLLCKQRSRNQR